VHMQAEKGDRKFRPPFYVTGNSYHIKYSSRIDLIIANTLKNMALIRYKPQNEHVKMIV